MKKVIYFSALVSFLLMSFSKSNENNIDEEILQSPECFQYADIQTGIHSCGFESYEDEHNYWVQQYEDCENVTNYDEFQFPPF